MSAAKKTIIKKTVAKKAVAKKEKPLIKYSDKSKGQPEMVVIFNRIKKLLLPYEKGVLKIHGGEGGQIFLISHKEVTIAGKKRPELWFASALIQKGYVGFYYMPVYGYKKLGEQIHPELMKCLKGKACFHIKKNDENLYKQIEEALQIGYDSYKKLGWV